MEKQRKNSPLIGISIGDINGIGPEVILKVLADSRLLQHFTPVIYASSKIVSYFRKAYDLEKLNYHQAKSWNEINPRKVNVINCWEENVEIQAGQVNETGGKYAAISLLKATEDLKDNKIDAIVTGPINKKNIQREEFNFPGHTEFFASKFEAAETVMMLVSEDLRVGVLTGHIPLKNVADKITKDKLTTKLKIMEKSLIRDFGIIKPKIAVLGLNPHAGDDGLLGNEEERVIEPVISELKNKGKLIFGPFSSDGFFGSALYKKYDGVMAMYHDQGLIPFKTIAFQDGVNFTAGLPVVRTSPDHGTAYDLAGKGIADQTSMLRAMMLATDILKSRNEMTTEKKEVEPG